MRYTKTSFTDLVSLVERHSGQRQENIALLEHSLRIREALADGVNCQVYTLSAWELRGILTSHGLGNVAVDCVSPCSDIRPSLKHYLRL